jgi:hypothetical protein
MYISKLPALEAERSLSRVQETAAAFGSMEESDQKSYLRQLRLTASGGRQRGVEKASPASLAAMHIAVETVSPGGVLLPAGMQDPRG